MELYKITNENLDAVEQLIKDDPRYGNNEALIRIYFSKHSLNNEIEEIAAKISLVDITNSTNLSKNKASLFDIANIILNIKDFDSRVSQGDPSLVNEIAKKCKENFGINIFSFASKYCRYHNVICYQKDDYAIFDSVVSNNLYKFIPTIKKGYPENLRLALDYESFNNLFTKLLDDNHITTPYRRLKLDHFIWYHNK